MTINEVAAELCRRETGKNQLSITQAKTAIRHLAEITADVDGAAECLMKYSFTVGRNRTGKKTRPAAKRANRKA